MRALVVLAVLAAGAPAAAAPPPVRSVSLPRTAVAGSAWQAVLRSATAPTLVATGASTLRAKAVRRSKGVFRATLTFPQAGTWTIAARAGGRTTRLGAVAVDVRADPLLVDPLTIAAERSGSLLVGQQTGDLVRLVDGRATRVAGGGGALQVTTAPNGTVYVAAGDGTIRRVDGTTLTPISPVVDASGLAADDAGNVYFTVYAGWVRKLAPDGTVTTLAGNGTEGFSGDGGPAAAATLFHPHSIALGADGALYVSDTENRRIRRIDLATGRIASFGGDVGITVAVAVAADGTVYSADVVRNGTGGGITRTTPQGVTTRVGQSADANGVAVAADGTVYANLWQLKRIQRLNPRTGALEPFARG
jgi:streptogramin lyase